MRARETETNIMSIIGIFTKDKSDHYDGVITTLTVQVKASFVPNTNQSENAPDYRILANNKHEVGAAWLRTSNDKQFLSVKLDDPFAAPVFANLIEAENKSFQLIWSRRSAD